MMNDGEGEDDDDEDDDDDDEDDDDGRACSCVGGAWSSFSHRLCADRPQRGPYSRVLRVLAAWRVPGALRLVTSP